MNKPIIGVVLICTLFFAGCETLTRGLGTAGEHIGDLGQTMVLHAEAEEALLDQLEAGEITQAEYAEQARAMRTLAAESQRGKLSLAVAELKQIAGSVENELLLNADDAAGTFIGGLAQGQDIASAGMAALMALLGAGGMAYTGRRREKREGDQRAYATEVARSESKAAMHELDARRSTSRLEFAAKLKNEA